MACIQLNRRCPCRLCRVCHGLHLIDPTVPMPPVQGVSWLANDGRRQAMLKRWTIAFVRSTMWHVREECDLEAQLEVTLSDFFIMLPPLQAMQPQKACT
jgi:hypothetical protein